LFSPPYPALHSFPTRRSSDLVVFATGTPVSNSMTELYTVMRYLQYDTLQKKNLTHFDCWASTFGETTTAIELAPEGTGYRARTRDRKSTRLNSSHVSISYAVF